MSINLLPSFPTVMDCCDLGKQISDGVSGLVGPWTEHTLGRRACMMQIFVNCVFSFIRNAVKFVITVFGRVNYRVGD